MVEALSGYVNNISFDSYLQTPQPFTLQFYHHSKSLSIVSYPQFKMPTLKQKTAFTKMVENIGNANPKTMGEILLESGYSEAISKSPDKVVKSKAWNEMLSEIDDEPLIKNLNSMALDKKDKRASLQATDMLLKLKGRYPNQNNSSDDAELLRKLRE